MCQWHVPISAPLQITSALSMWLNIMADTRPASGQSVFDLMATQPVASDFSSFSLHDAIRRVLILSYVSCLS